MNKRSTTKHKRTKRSIRKYKFGSIRQQQCSLCPTCDNSNKDTLKCSLCPIDNFKYINYIIEEFPNTFYLRTDYLELLFTHMTSINEFILTHEDTINTFLGRKSTTNIKKLPQKQAIKFAKKFVKQDIIDIIDNILEIYTHLKQQLNDIYKNSKPVLDENNKPRKTTIYDIQGKGTKIEIKFPNEQINIMGLFRFIDIILSYIYHIKEFAKQNLEDLQKSTLIKILFKFKPDSKISVKDIDDIFNNAITQTFTNLMDLVGISCGSSNCISFNPTQDTIKNFYPYMLYEPYELVSSLFYPKDYTNQVIERYEKMTSGMLDNMKSFDEIPDRVTTILSIPNDNLSKLLLRIYVESILICCKQNVNENNCSKKDTLYCTSCNLMYKTPYLYSIISNFPTNVHLRGDYVDLLKYWVIQLNDTYKYNIKQKLTTIITNAIKVLKKTEFLPTNLGKILGNFDDAMYNLLGTIINTQVIPYDKENNDLFRKHFNQPEWDPKTNYDGKQFIKTMYKFDNKKGESTFELVPISYSKQTFNIRNYMDFLNNLMFYFTYMLSFIKEKYIDHYAEEATGIVLGLTLDDRLTDQNKFEYFILDNLNSAYSTIHTILMENVGIKLEPQQQKIDMFGLVSEKPEFYGFKFKIEQIKLQENLPVFKHLLDK